MPFAGMSHGDDDGASDDDLVAAEDAGTSLTGTHLSGPHKYSPLSSMEADKDLVGWLCACTAAVAIVRLSTTQNIIQSMVHTLVAAEHSMQAQAWKLHRVAHISPLSASALSWVLGAADPAWCNAL